MARIVECIEGHYETKEMPYGWVYKWYPEHVVVECECGERIVVTRSVTICGCGADHTAVVREALAATEQSGDEVSHPWRAQRSPAAEGIPF